MPRIRFRWIFRHSTASAFFFFYTMSSFHVFSFRDKVLDLQMHELSSPSVLLHIFHLIWISSENIFLIQPRWSSKAWWSVLQPKGGQGKHSPWGETIFKQLIWQVFIKAPCILKIESDYISDSHLTSPCGKIVMNLVKISINKRYMF